VVEVQLIRCATDYTFPAISLPDRKLNRRWYHSATLNVPLCWSVKTIVSFNGNEAVFKYLAVLVPFLPGFN
jgi:hypothetical protein